MSVVVATYDPDWPFQFEQERARLEPVLEPWLSTPMQHIGSTSIPGLPAKPILDMMAGVHDLDQARGAIEPLATLGYVHAEHRPRALWFYRPSDDDASVRTHHLHLTEPGSDLWQERLTFRDALRADPTLAGEYRDLKQYLAEQHPHDITAYTVGKRAFVAGVLGAHGIELKPRT